MKSRVIPLHRPRPPEPPPPALGTVIGFAFVCAVGSLIAILSICGVFWLAERMAP